MNDVDKAKIALLEQAARAAQIVIGEVQASTTTNEFEKDWCSVVFDAYTGVLEILKDKPE